MDKRKFFLFLLSGLFLLSCSSVTSNFVRKDYGSSYKMIKRVEVKVESNFKAYPLLPEIVKNVTEDILRLKKNYLIYTPKTEGYNKKLQGTLLIKVLKLKIIKTRIFMTLSFVLKGRDAKTIFWKSIAQASVNSDDKNLLKFATAYKEKFGKFANIFVAPIFVIVRDIVKVMPNPKLTDDEVMEKIELDVE